MRNLFYGSLLVNLLLVLALVRSSKFSYENVIQSMIRYRGRATIAMLGDSQTALGSWNSDLNRFDIAVIGRPSFTSEQLIPDTKVISQLHPNICFIMAGTNDAASNSFTLNSSKASYLTLVRNLKRTDVKPVLMTIPYRLQQELVNTRIDSLNTALRTIATSEHVDLIELGHHLNKGHNLNEAYNTDSIHLNHAGRQIWAGLLQQYIDRHPL